MVDLKWDIPATGKAEVDEDTLAAIDRGAEAADQGRTIALEEARKLIPKWISKFASRTPR
ncbi:MAG TPA: hypothetical protein VH640_21920 [Bryobacteraceae bacterium]|jgi:predicted transcriptional regulator